MNLASTFLAAYDRNLPLSLTTSSQPSFTMAQSYQVANDITQLRLARGERIRGRKIGFTNRSIWPIYNVTGPIWGPVWDSTLTMLGGAEAHLTAADLTRLAEPRLEPEIVFGLRATPASAAPADLIAAIDWVAHGYEIVQSHYSAWKFTAPDAVAAFGLHGRLFVGQPIAWREAPSPENDARWQAELATLSLALYCDNQLIATGLGNAALDSPLLALGFLVQTLQDQGQAPLQPGEVITTGTLTDAQPIHAGQRWESRISGSRLPGLRLNVATPAVA
jgi:2-oxo-3-hexenedioate decarboxylase